MLQKILQGPHWIFKNQMEIEGGGRFSARKLPSPIIHTDKQSNSFGSGDPRLKSSSTLLTPNSKTLIDTHRITDTKPITQTKVDTQTPRHTHTLRYTHTHVHLNRQTEWVKPMLHLSRARDGRAEVWNKQTQKNMENPLQAPDLRTKARKISFTSNQIEFGLKRINHQYFSGYFWGSSIY